MGKILTNDAEIRRLLRAAKSQPPHPHAIAIKYVPSHDVYLLKMSDGDRVMLKRELLQGLERATLKQRENVHIIMGGAALDWPDLDTELYVPALVEGVYGSRKWMAELGRKGGSARTLAKKKAARANGRKGGRPRKSTTSVA